MVSIVAEFDLFLRAVQASGSYMLCPGERAAETSSSDTSSAGYRALFFRYK